MITTGLSHAFPILITPLPSARRVAGVIIGPEHIAKLETEFIDAIHGLALSEMQWCQILVQSNRFRESIIATCTVFTNVPDATTGRKGLTVSFGVLCRVDALARKNGILCNAFLVWNEFFKRYLGTSDVLSACDVFAALSQKGNPEKELGVHTKAGEWLHAQFEVFSAVADTPPPGLFRETLLWFGKKSLASFRRAKPLSCATGIQPFFVEVESEIKSRLNCRLGRVPQETGRLTENSAGLQQSSAKANPSSTDSTEIETLVYSDFPQRVAQMNAFAERVVQFVVLALRERIGRQWKQSDDDIFLPHTLLISTILEMSPSARSGIELLPAELWIRQLSPRTMQAEEQLRMSDAAARIHKGAPLFNVALCFFAAGDFDRAFQYFTQAGMEDELSGRGSRYLVPTGDNLLADRAIIQPLGRRMIPKWKEDFQSISNKVLDHVELKALLAWLVQRAPDAFQTITALHRLRLLCDGLDNEASRYQMVRALADIVLAVESSLRRWQVGVEGQMFARMDELLKTNPASNATFITFHTDFTGKWNAAQRETGVAVNWTVSETFSRLAGNPNVAERIGVAAYLVVRLRNSLMHVNEEGLDIHNNPQLCLRVAGVAFAILRVSKHGNENTLSTL